MDEVAYLMRVRGLTQRDFAQHKHVTPQSVNQVFTGKVKMLTGQGRELLDWLGVRIKLEVIPDNERTLNDTSNGTS